MKFALVELHCKARVAEDIGQGIKRALFRRPEARERQVRSVVESTVMQGVDLIVLPGWSLVGKAPPDWLVHLSRGRTIVVEMIAEPSERASKVADKRWTFVLKDGACVIGPEWQRLAYSDEAWVKGRFSKTAKKTGDRLNQRRKWKLTDGHTAMLAVCGEINAVHHKGQDFLTAGGLNLTGVKVVVNPSHTRMSPQGSRNQRAFLSTHGLTLVTANAHDGSKDENASEVTAEIYWRGERLKTGKKSRQVSADGAVRVERVWLDDTTTTGSAVVLGSVDL